MMVISKKDIWTSKETGENFNPIDFKKSLNDPNYVILKSVDSDKTIEVSTGSLTSKYKRTKLGSTTNRNDVFSY